MNTIRYELEAYFPSLDAWKVTQWPGQEEKGDPLFIDDARSRMNEKQLRNPTVKYRVIKVTRSVVLAPA